MNLHSEYQLTHPHRRGNCFSIFPLPNVKHDRGHLYLVAERGDIRAPKQVPVEKCFFSAVGRGCRAQVYKEHSP